jgi:hypothetical protein
MKYASGPFSINLTKHPKKCKLLCKQRRNERDDEKTKKLLVLDNGSMGWIGLLP